MLKIKYTGRDLNVWGLSWMQTIPLFSCPVMGHKCHLNTIHISTWKWAYMDRMIAQWNAGMHCITKTLGNNCVPHLRIRIPAWERYWFFVNLCAKQRTCQNHSMLQVEAIWMDKPGASRNLLYWPRLGWAELDSDSKGEKKSYWRRTPTANLDVWFAFRRSTSISMILSPSLV